MAARGKKSHLNEPTINKGHRRFKANCASAGLPQVKALANISFADYASRDDVQNNARWLDTAPVVEVEDTVEDALSKLSKGELLAMVLGRKPAAAKKPRKERAKKAASDNGDLGFSTFRYNKTGNVRVIVNSTKPGYVGTIPQGNPDRQPRGWAIADLLSKIETGEITVLA